MLNILPPCIQLGYGFLVGEPIRDRICMIGGTFAPVYASFFHAFGRFYEGDPMTLQELVKLNIHELPHRK
jgi:hypothetical protein